MVNDIEDIVFEFSSYDSFNEDKDEDNNETEDGKPNKYQVRSALEHAIFINRVDIVKRIVKEYNIKLENQVLHVGLLYAIQNEDIKSMNGWFKYKVCPRYEHFEEIINNDNNNQEVLDTLLEYLKSLKNKNVAACYRIMKALCSLQLPDKRYTPEKETINPRNTIIKEIAKIMIDPLMYYTAENIYKEAMNEIIDYNRIIELIKFWEFTGYDDTIQNWIRGNNYV